MDEKPGLSFLELQLIRSAALSKTDQEIAELLERPVEEIKGIVSELIDHESLIFREKNIEHLQAVKENKLLAQEKKIRITRERKAVEARKKIRSEERTRQANLDEKRKVDKDRRDDRKVFKTRPVNLKDLVSVRIDHRTTVFVKPGTDIQKVKDQYQKRSNSTTHDETYTIKS